MLRAADLWIIGLHLESEDGQHHDGRDAETVGIETNRQLGLLVDGGFHIGPSELECIEGNLSRNDAGQDGNGDEVDDQQRGHGGLR